MMSKEFVFMLVVAFILVLILRRRRTPRRFPQDLPHFRRARHHQDLPENSGDSWAQEIARSKPCELERFLVEKKMAELDPMPVPLNPEDLRPDNVPTQRGEKERALERLLNARDRELEEIPCPEGEVCETPAICGDGGGCFAEFRRRTWGEDAEDAPPCETCGGFGQVGKYTGRRFAEEEWAAVVLFPSHVKIPCPDCHGVGLTDADADLEKLRRKARLEREI